MTISHHTAFQVSGVTASDAFLRVSIVFPLFYFWDNLDFRTVGKRGEQLRDRSFWRAERQRLLVRGRLDRVPAGASSVAPRCGVDTLRVSNPTLVGHRGSRQKVTVRRHFPLTQPPLFRGSLRAVRLLARKLSHFPQRPPQCSRKLRAARIRRDVHPVPLTLKPPSPIKDGAL